MILPVVAYGHPVLKRIAEDIEPDYPNLQYYYISQLVTPGKSKTMDICY